MSTSVTAEFGALEAAHLASRIVVASDSSLIEIPRVPLPAGWSARFTTVWFVVPAGYPAAQPDCFWADPELRLATGALPLNSALQSIPATGRSALWFSWHLGSWRPGRDGLLTYVRFIAGRFADAR